MRIICPNCHALYEVPDHLIGDRPRRLRCEECGHSWRVAPEDAPAALDPVLPAGDGPEAEPEMDEALHRRFGQATDAEARAEIQAALKDEAAAHPEAGHPYPEIAAPEPLQAPPAQDEAAGPDRFADLVRAARNNEVELEPEPMKPLQRAANPRFVAVLLILLILALIVVERHAIMHVLPGTVKLFRALHLA